MRRLILFITLVWMSVTVCQGQKKYEMVVEKTDGTSITINVEDIARTYFRERNGGDDPGQGDSIIGTWQARFSEDVAEIWDDCYEELHAYYQFKNDGTYVYVDVSILTDEWVEAFGGPKEEIYIDRGIWNTSGDKLFITLTESNDPEEEIGDTGMGYYKVDGDILILTALSGIVISLTFDRVPDSTIQKYLK